MRTNTQRLAQKFPELYDGLVKSASNEYFLEDFLVVWTDVASNLEWTV